MKRLPTSETDIPKDEVSLWTGVLMLAIILAGLTGIVMILRYGGSSIGDSDLTAHRPALEHALPVRLSA